LDEENFTNQENLIDKEIYNLLSKKKGFSKLPEIIKNKLLNKAKQTALTSAIDDENNYCTDFEFGEFSVKKVYFEDDCNLPVKHPDRVSDTSKITYEIIRLEDDCNQCAEQQKLQDIQNTGRITGGFSNFSYDFNESVETTLDSKWLDNDNSTIPIIPYIKELKINLNWVYCKQNIRNKLSTGASLVFVDESWPIISENITDNDKKQLIKEIKSVIKDFKTFKGGTFDYNIKYYPLLEIKAHEYSHLSTQFKPKSREFLGKIIQEIEDFKLSEWCELEKSKDYNGIVKYHDRVRDQFKQKINELTKLYKSWRDAQSKTDIEKEPTLAGYTQINNEIDRLDKIIKKLKSNSN